MAHTPPHKLLASRLAQIAREIGDLTAQTLAYGLLLRRWEPDLLPGQLPDEPGAASIEQALDECDLEAVRDHYSASGMDPSVYFYEEFLRAYDPSSSKKRGVRYSPPQVVVFMLRAVESILEAEFGEKLTDAVVIDPCCGLGTFLRHIEKNVSPLPRMTGVELSRPASELASILLPGCEVIHGDWLGDFSVDTEGRTLVVIGNPPYSGHSANPGKIGTLMADYRRGLIERNPKWLQDDYVKFIRMAQHHVRRAGRGVVAFITNHSYLFNPTFRAMRESLTEDFDLIHALDLQGNARRNDSDAGRDENVFPIQMGVGISFFVRRPERQSPRVRYVQMRGSRDEKLARLAEAKLSDMPWTDVPCAKPFCVFLPQDQQLGEEYARLPSVLDLFEERSVGFVTSRDAFAVDVDRDALLERISALREPVKTPDELRATYPIGDLDVDKARRTLLADLYWEDAATSVLYRPFDVRWAYYSPEIMERPRLPFMRQMMAENVALIVGRAGQATGSEVWDVVFCADRPVDLNLFRRGGATILPSYLYRNGQRRSNLRVTSHEPDLVLSYVYAVLHSGLYRTRYADFLRFDFPRIPPPKDESALGALANLGRELMELHLMRRDPTAAVDPAHFTIGGYELPGKFIADRSKTGLSEADKRHVEWIRGAVAETISIQHSIDEIVRSRAPWN